MELDLLYLPGVLLKRTLLHLMYIGNRNAQISEKDHVGNPHQVPNGILAVSVVPFLHRKEPLFFPKSKGGSWDIEKLCNFTNGKQFIHAIHRKVFLHYTSFCIDIQAT